ncbi:MAG: hypothetical protein EP330_19360 [Deltaproteobacteria bacterium]|nr:MAG: hypothetical protein EP330_19360 [Deltaproteobacteria bacterium]
MWLALLLTAAQADDFSTLLADSGWEDIGKDNKKETGEMILSLKEISGVQCLRAVATVDVPADKIYEVVTDVPAAKDFSSETLIASRVLGKDGNKVHYYQHLDIPGWTMASDRYWVLAGEDFSSGDTRAFRWNRFDWRSAYPDLATDLDTNHEGAVEPVTNYGAWVMTPEGGSTKATYFICSDPGGSLPEWLKKTAATKTLPNTVADVMREARKRTK